MCHGSCVRGQLSSCLYRMPSLPAKASIRVAETEAVIHMQFENALGHSNNGICCGYRKGGGVALSRATIIRVFICPTLSVPTPFLPLRQNAGRAIVAPAKARPCSWARELHIRECS